ncbi:phage holin family protein [Opitutaceae bacterium TAV4]|uniref:phage holin family protein n=1 Tax=Geminisphaera colitermitum TaxID=1148786 RepID=UPI0001965200|nr:phage holin family protein [Geminisphaera colitermitum]RRJ96880.1 phage holin family protein [Opitutaceae bacterium TAV4]RRK00822.1 phage holin family protein [Opitutaceae bacterium TAV3]
MSHPFLQLLIRWVVLALGVTLSTKVLPGIRCQDLPTLIVVVVLLSFFNAVLRPLLVLFTLPFIVLTMGFGLVLINALLFMLVSRLVEGFVVESFGWAVGGALIVGVTNLVMNSLMRRPPPPPSPPPGGGRGADNKPGDVIDV